MNNGTLQSAGCDLDLTGYGNGDFINNGRIIAGPSDVNLHNNATITGGTLSGSAGGAFRVSASTSATLNSLTSSGILVIENHSTTNITGTIVNTGTIVLNAGPNNVYLVALGGGTLAGNGSVFMNKSGGQPMIHTDGVLLSSNSITGAGSIGGNQGGYLNTATITANSTVGALYLDPGGGNVLTNSGTLRSTAGATMVISGCGGGMFAGSGSVDVQASAFPTLDNSASFTNGGVTNNGTTTVQSSSVTSIASITGAGTLNISGSSGVLVRANGTPAATCKVISLSIAGSSKLDLNDNALVVDYATTSPLSAVRSYIFSGYSSGSWNGSGIVASTLIGVSNKALGHAEATATPFSSNFRGQSFDGGNAVLVMQAFKGDANLDRIVDSLDFSQFSGGYGIKDGSALWSAGDFDYNGKINTIDFNYLAGNFGQTLPPGAELPGPSLGAIVPEPALLSLISASLFVRRRIRR